MTHPSDIRRQFSALALALLKANDVDPNIRSVRTKVFHALEQSPTAPQRALIENLLISASAFFLGIDPRPEDLLDHHEPSDLVQAIDNVTQALRQITT